MNMAAILAGLKGSGAAAGATSAGSAGVSPFRRLMGGAMSGFGQGIMSQTARRTHDTAGQGGYFDLMNQQRIGNWVRTGNRRSADETFSGPDATREIMEALLLQQRGGK